ncbi:MAG: hypothetical protein HQM09_23200 [Candidatus Riflebacteria bacterium]|nr:hypothetical protein [Candidatus Riflebacteria bacterium]
MARINEISDQQFLGMAFVLINAHEGAAQVVELLEKRPEMKSFAHRLEEARSSGRTTKCSDFRYKLGGEEWCGNCPEWHYCRTPLQLGLPHAMTRKRKLLVLRGDDHTMVCALEDGLKRAVEDGLPIYQYGNQIVRVRYMKGVPKIEDVSQTALKTELQEHYQMVYEDEEGNEKQLPGVPSGLAQQLLERRRWAIPAIRGIVNCPTFAENGSIATTEGYDPTTETILNLGGRGVPTVPHIPTEADVANAKRLIFDEFLVDFKFKDIASLANITGLCMLPFIRPLIDGPLPLHLVSADKPGYGKSKLIDLIGFIATGGEAYGITAADKNWAWNAIITSTLCEQPTIVCIDNFDKKLDSAPLARLLTCTEWNDRVYRTTNNVTVQNNAIWCATANKPKLSAELTRRTVLIQFKPIAEDPAKRTGFKHSNIVTWVKDARSQLLQAFLILVRNWFAKGRPGSDAVMGSYEAYTQIVGGLLEVNGIPGFLGNQQELSGTVDAAEVEIEAFVQSWAGTFGAERVSPSQLVRHIESHELMKSVICGKTVDSKKNVLGRTLRDMNNTNVCGYLIQVHHNTRNKTYSYSLTPVTEESVTIESNPADEPVSTVPAR